jgi:hypothetical protein
MFVYRRVLAVVTAMVLCIATASAQQASAEGDAASRIVRFNVVVTTASGECVTDLQERDFKVFDNNVTQQPIVFFRAGPISPKGVWVPHLAYAGSARTNGCFQESGIFRYEITFNVPGDARLNEYRSVGILVDRPNLIVRAPQGYYVRP